jgi:hypothetical protein
VVHAGGAELDRQQRARPVPQLVAVHPQAQPRVAPGGQHRARLVAVEGVGRVWLAEDVDPLRVRGSRRQHRPGDELDVCRAVAGRLGRHHVRPQERRLLGELAGDAQRPRLVLDGQAVAALDLHGGRALGPHLRHAGGDQPRELGVVGRPGGRHRHPDAAPVVPLPGHPRGELGGPVAGEHQVGV